MQEADLSKPFKKEIKVSGNENQHLVLSNVQSDNTKHRESVTQPKPEVSFIENIEISPIPKTAVQFIINWRRYTLSDIRYRYLKVTNKFLHLKYDIFRNLNKKQFF